MMQKCFSMSRMSWDFDRTLAYRILGESHRFLSNVLSRSTIKGLQMSLIAMYFYICR